MPRPVFITGHAGTGKATLLLDRIASYGRKLLEQDHQRLLAITFMHGARHRLAVGLSEHPESKHFKRLVSTIDSLALRLVNQYRLSLGYGFPVLASVAACDDACEKHLRVHLSFDKVVVDAAQLLRSSRVRATVASSFPLVVVDEFQDCAGPRLALIAALSDCAQVIVAADPFQVLVEHAEGCPAADWIANLPGGVEEKHELSHVWRTTNRHILNAATAIRHNQQASQPSLTVLQGSAPMVAFKIIERLALGWEGPRWSGTTAIISPKSTGVVDEILYSMAAQLEKRKLPMLKWQRLLTAEEQSSQICRELWPDSGGSMERNSRSPTAEEIIFRAGRFARLRGLGQCSEELVRSFVDRTVSASRAFGLSSSRLVVTSVHGAKNREFENVFVVWPYAVKADEELRRRLLYNAVTRAKINCMIFDTRIKKGTPPDPVMQLLGEPRPVFPKKT